jgi:hypothetical protein
VTRRDSQLGAGLRAAVLRRLELLDRVAARGDSQTLLPLARTELNRLADGWRLLLEVHRPDENGRCVACPHRMRGRRWPCQVWRLAHRHLIGDGQERSERHRPGAQTIVAPPDVPGEAPGELTIELPIVPPR